MQLGSRLTYLTLPLPPAVFARRHRHCKGVITLRDHRDRPAALPLYIISVNGLIISITRPRYEQQTSTVEQHSATEQTSTARLAGRTTRMAAPPEDYKLPNISDLHVYPDLDQAQLLDYLFEPSPAIHSTLLSVIRTALYSTYPSLIDACRERLVALAGAASSTTTTTITTTTATTPDATTLLSILGSHPRLGEKKITSAQSAAEQAQLQGEGEQLAVLNREYEDKFPGLRYVAFVNGRGRPVIMQDMRERITRGLFDKEVEAGVQVRMECCLDGCRGHRHCVECRC